MAIDEGDLPHEWREAMYSAARRAVRSLEGSPQHEIADRVAGAVIMALLSTGHVVEQVREVPLVDPVPTEATMDLFRLERRLAIYTPPEPCAGYTKGRLPDVDVGWRTVLHSIHASGAESDVSRPD